MLRIIYELHSDHGIIVKWSKMKIEMKNVMQNKNSVTYCTHNF